MARSKHGDVKMGTNADLNPTSIYTTGEPPSSLVKTGGSKGWVRSRGKVIAL